MSVLADELRAVVDELDGLGMTAVAARLDDIAEQVEDLERAAGQ